ncbi:protein MENT [Anolis sagrei]|uniref:protein MENT n=1 Tax=Anolis sagrei TaxID=38937 RepID=UPI00352112CC
MAAGGAWMLVLFVLWDSRPPGTARAQDMDEGQVSAPPELLAMVPAAAEAIVAAGYTSGHHEGANTTPPPPVATVVVSNVADISGGGSSVPVLPSALVPEAAEPIVTAGYTTGHQEDTNTTPPMDTVVVSNVPEVSSGGSSVPELLAMVPAAAEAIVAAGYTGGHHEVVNTTPPPPVATVVVSNVPEVSGGSSGSVPVLPAASNTAKETFLIVGDTRYAWQEWSPWHCNCPAGSMSRVRDITYSAPGLRLDPLQYNILRFEREKCTYATCDCDRAQGQCDRKQVPCEWGATHLCALQDIEYDQLHRKERFWALVHKKLKKLLKAIKEVAANDQAMESSHRRARH